MSSLGRDKASGADGGLGGLVRALALSGQLDRPPRRRAAWLGSGERPGDRLVVGILLATGQAAPPAHPRRRAKRSWLM